MTTAKAIVVAALILNGGLLLSARCFAAAILGAGRNSYDSALTNIGPFLPFCALVCFGVAALVALRPLPWKSPTESSDEPKA